MRLGENADSPPRLAVAARLAIALDRNDHARPILERLRAMGYREAEFMAECRAAGLCEAEQGYRGEAGADSHVPEAQPDRPDAAQGLE